MAVVKVSHVFRYKSSHAKRKRVEKYQMERVATEFCLSTTPTADRYWYDTSLFSSRRYIVISCCLKYRRFSSSMRTRLR